MNKTIKFCMAGFGNVGKRFARLLLEKERELRSEYGCEMRLTGLCTRSKGALINPKGLDLKKIVERYSSGGGHFDEEGADYMRCGVKTMIETAGADLLIELTTLSIEDGEPAATHIREALNRGMHVITANKGPEAWHFDELNSLAQKKGRMFLYETIVMDGTPVFNMVKETLHGNRILSIKGILNGTTNFVLGELEKGRSYESAIKEAQRIQLAEADPSMDVDGWDGAAKICSLANILMGAKSNPKEVQVESMSGIGAEQIAAAREKGCKIKYICRAERDRKNGGVLMSVRPESVPLHDTFATVNGTSSALTLCTDQAGEISLLQTNPGILQTAYGVYSDLLTLIKNI
jgi:homoserine dehydrogenase